MILTALSVLICLVAAQQLTLDVFVCLFVCISNVFV